MGLICREKMVANGSSHTKYLPQNYENCLFRWTFNVVPVNVIHFEVEDGESWIFHVSLNLFRVWIWPDSHLHHNATISLIRIWHHKQFNCCTNCFGCFCYWICWIFSFHLLLNCHFNSPKTLIWANERMLSRKSWGWCRRIKTAHFALASIYLLSSNWLWIISAHFPNHISAYRNFECNLA